MKKLFKVVCLLPLQVKTQDGSVEADNVVLATNSPIHHNLAVHSRQEPYRSYVVGLRIPDVRPPSVLLPTLLLHCVQKKSWIDVGNECNITTSKIYNVLVRERERPGGFCLCKSQCLCTLLCVAML